MPSPAFSIYLILLTISLSYCFLNSIAGNNETDRLALLEIKAKIDDPLDALSSWNSSVHFCEWQGVTCGRRHQRVVLLSLYSSKLSGSISPFVGNLSFLKVLSLANNSFSGSIPSEIGKLQRLQTLKLFNNSIGGVIPPSLSHCYKLVWLNLHNNRLEGKIPSELGFLFKLQSITLNMNNLKGSIPSSLGNLSSLQKLFLGENQFVGKIPQSLGRLKSLTILSLPFNKLSGTVPPSIFNLSFLNTLDLQSNQFKGSLPPNFGITLPNIELISLSSNGFSGKIPTSLSNASKLQFVDLSDNSFTGRVPPLSTLQRLDTLFLSQNFLGTGQVDDLNFLYSSPNSTPVYENIDLTLNGFGGLFPKVVCNFTVLRYLYIAGNKISGEIPKCIKNSASLWLFSAEGNELVGTIPTEIGELENLNGLFLNGNRLSGYIPSSVGNLTKLSGLYLDGNNLNGHIPSSMENCKNLIDLDLSSNNFTGKIPSQLLSISSLSVELLLSDNRLSGNLASEVGKLTNLVRLDVSKNMLSGKIPSALGACVELQNLNMGGNFFHGVIPRSLKSLTSLLFLDLSQNNLSGEIPNFLENIHQLQHLNLSYNNFEGEVPTGGVFRNASSVSIQGNKGLCGGIPELKLPPCSFSKISTQRHRLKRKLMTAILLGLSGALFLVAIASLYVFRHMKKGRIPTTSIDSENSHSLSYQSILKATNGFSPENLIGSGTFGIVYKGTVDSNQTTVAIKKFNLEKKFASKTFKAECGILRKIRHRNLVKVITVCSGVDYQGNDFKALVYEYMVNGSLDDWLHPKPQSIITEATSVTPKNLNFLQRLDITVEVAVALEYLHHHYGTSIVHCDLKPSNVLLDDAMVAHVADFGLAKFLTDGNSISQANQSTSIGVRGTIGYTPPEYGLGNELSTQGDVYSFGILVLEIFTGKRPTNDQFTEGLNLQSFVQAALPSTVIDILDQALLEDIAAGEETNTTGAHILRTTGSLDILMDTLIAIFETALSCCAENPHERLDMSVVTAKLSSIRQKLRVHAG